jgi:uncharacterized protein (TIGR03000 family)
MYYPNYGYYYYQVSTQPAPVIVAGAAENGAEKAVGTPAKLTLHVPADAKLFVNDRAVKTDTGEVRQFTTPPLEPGQEYAYTFRVEAMHEGKPVRETRQVRFRAGSELQVAFPKVTPPIVTARSK